MNIILSDDEFDVLWSVVLDEILSSNESLRNAVGTPDEDSCRRWLDHMLAIKAAMERNKGGDE